MARAMTIDRLSVQSGSERQPKHLCAFAQCALRPSNILIFGRLKNGFTHFLKRFDCIGSIEILIECVEKALTQHRNVNLVLDPVGRELDGLPQIVRERFVPWHLLVEKLPCSSIVMTEEVKANRVG